MRPVLDNLEQLLDSDEEERYKNENELSEVRSKKYFDRGIIQAEALNFIRGRSFVQTYLIIDEAQNMTPNQVKGIITRAGKGQKSFCWGIPTRLISPSWTNAPTVCRMRRNT
jgi:PhoH-like ATPase